jgi:hypothetical protein
MDADVIVVLRRLAESCQYAAGSVAELAERYGALRAEVMNLNDQHGWATPDDLALIQFAGWATGVRLAYETLQEMDSP